MVKKSDFSKGFHDGWEASKTLDWQSFDELEANAAMMGRAGKDESCGYWSGIKAGQEYACERPDPDQSYDAGNGMLVSYRR